MAKKKKEQQTEPHFVVTFKIKAELWQIHKLEKYLETCRRIYNSIVDVSIKQLHKLENDKHYKELIASLDHNEKDTSHDEAVYKEIDDLRVSYGLTEFGLKKMATPLKQHYGKTIGIHIVQALASCVWNAYEDYFFGDGKKIHYRKYGQRNSFEGQDNKTGVRFKPEERLCCIGKLKLPVTIDDKNPYEMEAIEHEIAHCRILRKSVRGKNKFYLQVIFKGLRPAKRRKSDGSFTQILGQGDVGIDIGVSTVAYSADTDVKIVELADKAQGYERERLRLQRKLDRSKRANNPDNFNADGTCKRSTKKRRLVWKRSKRYNALIMQIREIYRRQAAIRLYQHNMLTNEILKLGDTFYVEDMNFKGLQKRAKKTEKNEKGKNKRKKRFGKSLANRAPAMFLTILDRKLGYFGKKLIKINTFTVKASQYNHVSDTYKKKKLYERWNDINGIRIQRDLYSAFLIQNVASDLKSVDKTKCDNKFSSFLNLHQKEIERLSNKRNISCVGV